MTLKELRDLIARRAPEGDEILAAAESAGFAVNLYSDGRPYLVAPPDGAACDARTLAQLLGRHRDRVADAVRAREELYDEVFWVTSEDVPF